MAQALCLGRVDFRCRFCFDITVPLCRRAGTSRALIWPLSPVFGTFPGWSATPAVFTEAQGRMIVIRGLTPGSESSIRRPIASRGCRTWFELYRCHLRMSVAEALARRPVPMPFASVCSVLRVRLRVRRGNGCSAKHQTRSKQQKHPLQRF